MVSLKKLGWENYTNQVIEGLYQMTSEGFVESIEVKLMCLPQPEKFEHYRIAKEQNQ